MGQFFFQLLLIDLSKTNAHHCFILFDYIYEFNQINLYNDLWIYSGKLR